MLKLTVMLGRVREGDSFTGNRGISVMPTIARQTNETITVKEDMIFFSAKTIFFICPL
jgi:hypothetical protein